MNTFLESQHLLKDLYVTRSSLFLQYLGNLMKLTYH